MVFTLSAFAVFVPVAWYFPLNIKNSDLVFRSPPFLNGRSLFVIVLAPNFDAAAVLLDFSRFVLWSATFLCFCFCLYASCVRLEGDGGSVALRRAALSSIRR